MKELCDQLVNRAALRMRLHTVMQFRSHMLRRSKAGSTSRRMPCEQGCSIALEQPLGRFFEQPAQSLLSCIGELFERMPVGCPLGVSQSMALKTNSPRNQFWLRGRIRTNGYGMRLLFCHRDNTTAAGGLCELAGREAPNDDLLVFAPGGIFECFTVEVGFVRQSRICP